ncbi:MAG TPA: pyruvate:ferredoxin (flavodoxin) oxidoreductase, partial [bacterium]|nr:pyruvate:ferredoxin (flavodoxin) oxidoreductase [bacterium]
VQEAQDLGLVAHLSAIRSSLPFIHFFDGFRTSHEVNKIAMIDYDDIKSVVDHGAIAAFKDRALRPERPILKGTAQNPDIFFQARETCNPYYDAVPQIVQEEMEKVFSITGRRYKLFDYVGHPEAERIIIAMGSGCETIDETICHLMEKGEKVGVVKVRLYRPFSVEHLMQALPRTVKAIAVLDRTKEPGSEGEPLYKDVVTALYEQGDDLIVVGGRYGLSSKEFTPGMVKAVFDNLKGRSPKHNFTVGITDDVSFTSLPYEPLDTVPAGTTQAKFWGFGSDGTVGANKDAIKIIGDNTDMFAQGYFQYDSKKSGGVTVSHLRFGKMPIRSTYLLTDADYIACHRQAYVYLYDLTEGLKQNGTFVLNTSWSKDELEEKLPAALKRDIAKKNAKFYIIDAVKIAEEVGLGGRINMVMQTAFFKLAGVLPFDKAITLLKKAVEKTYGRKGEKVVKMNHDAIDRSAAALHEFKYDAKKWADAPDTEIDIKKVHEPYADGEEQWFVETVIGNIAKMKGDRLPSSCFNADGSFPTATTKFEKRGVAIKLPKWISANCISCNQCSFVCPHAAIRPVLVNAEEKAGAPKSFETIKPKGKAFEGYEYRMQVYPMDCQGCGNCADVCPAPKKALDMVFFDEIAEVEAQNNDFSIHVPVRDTLMKPDTVTGSQYRRPLFEFSGACAGCGETPYVKLLTQLFGDRMVVSNATGCSSIYGGTAPTIPYCTNKDGCGPAWANSLFEDNAEHGYGMAIAIRQKRERIEMLMKQLLELKCDCGDDCDCGDECPCELAPETKKLFEEWIANKKSAEKTRELAPKLEEALTREACDDPRVDELLEMADYFVKKSVWIIGGDGWAYDIGYGGLDHVLASGEDVNVLVLDTEVYSNTGGQASKASQFGQVAKFAASGKKMRKKDLGLISMTYGYIYVASVAMGANQNQTLKAMLEAEQYDGPSIVIAYSPCINHGIDMTHSQKEMKLAVETGLWPLYRYNPTLKKEGKNNFQLDMKEPTRDVQEIINSEVRFKTLEKQFPDEAKKLHQLLREDLKDRWERLKKLAEHGF